LNQESSEREARILTYKGRAMDQAAIRRRGPGLIPGQTILDFWHFDLLCQ